MTGSLKKTAATPGGGAGSAALPAGAGAAEMLRARHWESLAQRTRLASSGPEMRALHDDSRLTSYITGSAQVPLGQLEILESGDMNLRG